MLSELQINNIAIIKEQTLKFAPGFNVLTGETGAGKSIIIGSVGLITGARASRESLRSGEKKAVVTALFTDISSHTQSQLEQFGITVENNELSISREINESGNGAARINGKSIPVSQLKDITPLLINIHGQHASQALLDEENHIKYLDEFSDVEKELSDYSVLFSKASDIKSRIADLTKDTREKNRRIEMLKFQIGEIGDASLKSGEEEELDRLRIKAENAEKLSKYAKFVYKALYRNEKGNSASDLAVKATEALGALSDVLPKSSEYSDYLTNFTYMCEDIAETVMKECGTDIKDPEKLLDQIESRLDLIRTLKRKYGNTVEEIVEFKDKAEKELNTLETADDTIVDLKNELDTITKEMASISTVISKKRRMAADALEERMTKELMFLEMNKVRFSVDMAKSDIYRPDGTDVVRFLISANAGEPLAPLAKIASGGELSRTMLALKSALSDKEKTPTLIFDEIDTGISGKTSYKLGVKLKSCSETAQVICVTHSPQIASQADCHMLVSKHEENGRTLTVVKELDKEGRIREIARIIGSEKITDKTLKAAEEMLCENK